MLNDIFKAITSTTTTPTTTATTTITTKTATTATTRSRIIIQLYLASTDLKGPSIIIHYCQNLLLLIRKIIDKNDLGIRLNLL